MARPYTFTPPFEVKCQHHSAAWGFTHASSSNTSCRNEVATKHGLWHSCRTVSGALFLTQFGSVTHAYQANLRTLAGPDRSPQRSYLLYSSFPFTQAGPSNQQSLALNGKNLRINKIYLLPPTCDIRRSSQRKPRKLRQKTLFLFSRRPFGLIEEAVLQKEKTPFMVHDPSRTLCH